MYSTDNIIRNELEVGEKLYWSGGPQQGLRLQASDIILIPFSLMWGGFAIFWEASAIRMGAPLFFILWGIPFVLLGLYLIVGRFFIDAYARSNTYYGITNKRVIIVGGLFSRKIISHAKSYMQNMRLEESGNGRGTIYLKPEDSSYSRYHGRNWSGHITDYDKLDNIEDAREAYNFLTREDRYS